MIKVYFAEGDIKTFEPGECTLDWAQAYVNGDVQLIESMVDNEPVQLLCNMDGYAYRLQPNPHIKPLVGNVIMLSGEDLWK